MATYYPPPSPHIGGHQPLEPRRQAPSEPPLPPPYSIVRMLSIVNQWFPPPYPHMGGHQPHVGPKLTPPEPPLPPPYSRAWMLPIVTQWFPPPYPHMGGHQPHVGPKLTPPEPPLPPPTSWAKMMGVIGVWHPIHVPPPLFVKRRFYDNPPYVLANVLVPILLGWVPPFQYPQVPFRIVLPAGLPPPPPSQFLAIWKAWPPEFRLPQRAPFLVTQPPPNPPFGNRNLLPYVLKAWETYPPIPFLPHLTVANTWPIPVPPIHTGSPLHMVVHVSDHYDRRVVVFASPLSLRVYNRN